MGLRKRILHAGAWTLAAYALENLLRLASSLILSRLLFPEAFGLVAASTSLITAFVLFSDLGILALIIQSSRGDNPDFLGSVWVFQVLRGFGLWCVLAIVCLVIALPVVRSHLPAGSAFANELFPILTTILGLGLILNGLESTSLSLNIRQLRFRTPTIIDLVTKIIMIVGMIGLAIPFRNVWALAAGNLIAQAVRLIMTHTIVSGPRMAWRWNRDHFQEIFHFGKWITVSSVASFFTSQLDIIVLGLLLPGTALGVYVIARTIMGAAEGLVDRVNSNLALSVLGEVLRENPSELRSKYYRFRLPIEATSALLAGLLFVTGPLVVRILYDVRYQEAGPMLSLLAIGLAIYPFQVIRSAFTAIGQTYTVAVVSIVQAASLASFMIIGYLEFGMLGAVAGISISRVIPSLVFLVLGYRLKWISVCHEIRSIPVFVLGWLLGETILLLGRTLAPETLQRFLTN